MRVKIQFENISVCEPQSAALITMLRFYKFVLFNIVLLGSNS